jgi:hypothetical protein
LLVFQQQQVLHVVEVANCFVLGIVAETFRWVRYKLEHALDYLDDLELV